MHYSMRDTLFSGSIERLSVDANASIERGLRILSMPDKADDFDAKLEGLRLRVNREYVRWRDLARSARRR